jgi:predicted phage terminase large subunit-like protein
MAARLSESKLRLVERQACEGSLRFFIKRAWRYMDPARYLHNWHIDAIGEHLEAVSRGEIRRLIINVPPRHMKSLSVSVAWPAWVWAQPERAALIGPQVSWLFSSYAHTLSLRDSVKCRRLMGSAWYQGLWGDRFALTGDQNTKIRFDNDRQGYRLATSVDGALTGEGGDVIVVDDPHNVREADSEAVRESVLTWWDEAMSTRLNDPRVGAYVIIMQRVHERDLTGHILARNQGYEHLCLPARYEADHPHCWPGDPREVDGELLWPERIGEREMQALEAALGSYGTAGQLQQRPAPRGGGMFQKHWFPIVDVAPAQGSRVRGWDLAATDPAPGKRPDWTAGVKMSRGPDGIFYIEDVVRFQGAGHKVEAAIINTTKQDNAWSMTACKVRLPQDPGQAGKSQAQYLARQLPGFIVVIKPVSGAKTLRAQPFASQAEAGNVRLIRGPWNAAFLDELSGFPFGSNDDQVDAAADAFNELALERQVATKTSTVVGMY